MATFAPDEYARQFKIDLDIHDLLSERSRHADDGGIGASSFGCREEMRRTIAQVPPSDSPDKLAAYIGTYIDHGIGEARKAANPNLLLKLELPVTLPNGLSFPVHPDEIDPDEPSSTNYKTKNGLAAIRRGFVDDQARLQRHLEYLAAHQAGLVSPEGIVRNVFVDRSGVDQQLHVEQEPFSMVVIEQATDFADDVLYAVKHKEEAIKDRPRVFCKNFCRWYSDCRGSETVVEKITDPQVAALVDAAGDADQAAKVERQLVDELKDAGLRGLTGHTERYRIVSTWINSAKQQPHYRVELEPLESV